MMEQFLNALLMGRDPKNGQRPEKPGFMIIGTQNPINMAGRRAASTALLRRMTTVILPEYDTNEIRSILVHKGIFYWDAVVMADAYQNKLDEAKKFHLSPMPCLRDLLKLADQQIKRVHLAQQRAALLSPPPKHDLPESTPEDTYSFFHAKKAKNTTTDATETMDNDHQPPSPRI